MGTGTVVGSTKIVDNGPDEDQWNLVIVGDGYTATEQNDFNDAADDFVDILASSPPFDGPAVWDRVNVHRLEVHSDESGALNPETCADGTTPFAASASTAVSYFDAEYCASGLRRALVVDRVKVLLEVGALVPEVDVILVLVNHVEPGGTGSPGMAVCNVGGIYDGTASHEIGHSAFGLADEYDYYAGCDSGETGHDLYTGLEPLEPNVTINADRATIKWAQYIDPATPMPTTTNPDPTQCDTQPSPVAVGEIGAFDGAYYHHSGAYRPAYRCAMRDTDDEYCTVCRDSIIGQILVEDSNCLIATAVYDDPWARDVVALRQWRNRTIRGPAPTAGAMRALDRAYRRISPPVARYVQPRPWLARPLRTLVFAPLAQVVRT